MDKTSGQKSAHHFLYPPIDPYDHGIMQVDRTHRIYVEQCGNPDGIPVVVLHGGPGGGCSPAMRRYFDPQTYRIILFDQRGCGRSQPAGSVQDNTSWHLIADIEKIRETLGIDRWAVFGGSWGATLALLYAETHPDRVAFLALRGVFLMRPSELTWFYGGGAGQFWPEHWQQFVDMIPSDERSDLVAAYHRRLFSGNMAVELRYAKIWAGWENALASITYDGPLTQGPANYARIFARLECHYFYNLGFLDDDNYILNNIDRLSDIPGKIVQGRYDMICPPGTAHALHEAWPASSLTMVPRAGHALSEPGITSELVRTMEQVARNRVDYGL